ncbi:hypothetical protein CULCOIPH001_09360 [Corynebacterium ulcerans]|nr:hypothetical protein CULCOIPH001_09360 [Corynebacterium ulcerans]
MGKKFCPSFDSHNKNTGSHGVEGARVANPFSAKDTAQAPNYVMRGHASGFIDDYESRSGEGINHS